MRIRKTYNYAMFRKMQCNRDVKGVKTLQENIETFDLTPYVPIIVSEDYEIIDGQHRFEACETLGKPIYYIVYKGEYSPEQAMIALNTVTKVWRQEEWFQYYVKTGNENYVKLKEMSDKFDLGISNNILLFSNGKTNAVTFKRGKLLDDSRYYEAVYDFVKDLQVPFRTYRQFIAAVLRFIEKYEGQPRKLQKLKRKIIAVPKFGSLEQFYNAFENITK